MTCVYLAKNINESIVETGIHLHLLWARFVVSYTNHAKFNKNLNSRNYHLNWATHIWLSKYTNDAQMSKMWTKSRESSPSNLIFERFWSTLLHILSNLKLDIFYFSSFSILIGVVCDIASIFCWYVPNNNTNYKSFLVVWQYC